MAREYLGNNDLDKLHEPVLLLNGFGVGSFHQHRLMSNLLKNENGEEVDDKMRVIYGIDYLGQGKSWPINCDDGNSKNEEGLIYSADTWAEQIIQFIEEIILPNHADATKVHLVGNSVGGYLSVLIANKRPDLIQSICLLNATPIWGLNLPGWSGNLPPPPIPRIVGRFLFDKIRDLGTIEQYLETAYYHREAFDDDLMRQIQACTEGKGGHAAFASILWSPPATFSTDSANDFATNLAKVQCDTLLVFGKEDPWCTSSVGKKMYDILSQRNFSSKPVQRYIELENVGHCPNHEAPQAVAAAVKRWLDMERKQYNVPLVDSSGETFHEQWGQITSRELNAEDAKMTIMDRIMSEFVV